MAIKITSSYTSINLWPTDLWYSTDRTVKQTLIKQHSSLCRSVQSWWSDVKSEVMCGQEWWPLLRICGLHLTHPSAHTQQWTHTRGSGQPYYCGARGEAGGPVPSSRVSPQSCYWRWKIALVIHSPHRQFLPDLRIEPVTFALQVRLTSHDCRIFSGVKRLIMMLEVIVYII